MARGPLTYRISLGIFLFSERNFLSFCLLYQIFLIIFDVKAGPDALSVFDESFTVGYNDLFDDVLYFVKDNYIYSLDTDVANSLTLTWKGKDHDFNRPVSFSKCRVISDDYSGDNVHLLIYVDRVLFKNMTIQGEKVYNLPRRRKDEVWCIEVKAASTIKRIGLAQSIGDFI